MLARILLRAVLPAIALALVLGVLGFGWWLYRVQVWEGDVAAVVRSTTHADAGRLHVRLTGPAPADALGTTLPRWIAVPVVPGATEGEALTCRIRQTYQPQRHLATGPDVVVLWCRR